MIEDTTWPKQVVLYAVALSWELNYHHDPEATKITLLEEENKLLLNGSIKEFKDCQPHLHSWLQTQANHYITPWIERLSREFKFSYQKLTFRGQKTLWGSCSGKQDISLNYKLLFLPARLMRYVLIHELSHTQHLDHSKDFWRCVERCEPDYRRLRQELKQADRYLPTWLKT